MKKPKKTIRNNSIRWVKCPICKTYRMVKFTTYKQINAALLIGVMITCRVCCKLKTKNHINNNYDLKPVIETIKINGCTLVRSESGRGKECIFCTNYMECLYEVGRIDWAGWNIKETKNENCITDRR